MAEGGGGRTEGSGGAWGRWRRLGEVVEARGGSGDEFTTEGTRDKQLNGCIVTEA